MNKEEGDKEGSPVSFYISLIFTYLPSLPAQTTSFHHLFFSSCSPVSHAKAERFDTSVQPSEVVHY